MRILRALLTTVGVLALVATGAGIWTVRRSFPVLEGEVAVGGLSGAVTVRRDAAGVPHISGSDLEDLFMAQGYVHAQDRFWQMDTWRHIGAGRLAEMFGEGQVETDAFLRTLGFERLAQEAYATMAPETKTVLDAYAAGVNAYLAERPAGSPLALEYSVLGLQTRGYRPEPWKPVHSLTWAHVMAWDLRSNLEHEIERARLSAELGTERAEALYPPHPADHPPIVGEDPLARHPAPELPDEADEALARAGAGLAAAASTLGRPLDGIGSNSWVVDGRHTDSGLPLLANDPHLGIQLPSIWYQATLWCEDVTPECPMRVAGFTFPGAPGVVIGHNQRIAWGLTNEAPDTMDLFVERIDGDRYQVEGEWLELDSRTETIEVAGGDDVELEIRTTHHGPIISRHFEPAQSATAQSPSDSYDYEIALAWQALEPATLFSALLGINFAHDWDSFRRAASLFDIAPQNLVYADVDGHIGYQSTGEIPIRRSGDGRYPVPGWTGEYDWEGLVPFEDLPYLFDPPSGTIVAANQPVVGSGHPVLIGIDHDYGYRAARIAELLEESGSDLTGDDMAQLQTDAYDASAALVVPAVLEVVDESSRLAGPLRQWAGEDRPFQMDADSPGAAAYGAIWRHLLASTFEELPEEHAPAGSSRYFAVMAQLLDDPESPWWDDTTTAAVETSADILLRAAQAAEAELVDRLGDEPASWRWGDLHVARFENQTLGQSGIAPIEAIFNREAPARVGGGSSIVNANGWLAHEGYEVVSLPSLRMVVDLSQLSNSVGIHSTGQSGHAFHSNYFDMNSEWTDGVSRPMPFEPGEVATVHTLELSPGG